MRLEQNAKHNDQSVHALHGTLLHRWWIMSFMVGIICLGMYACTIKSDKASSHTAKQGLSANQQSIPVVTIAARLGDINIYLTGLGSVTPDNTITIKSRVNGELMKVFFHEGQFVKEGELLALIDPRPYQAQLIQAQGQMLRDQALLKNAQLDLTRYKSMGPLGDYISQQQYDTQKALVQQYIGTVKLDQGQIDNAKLQLAYCTITSPINGRVGLRLVDPGNIIQTTDTTGLVVITQLQPISVIFSIPEDNLPPVLAKLKAGERLTVDAYDRELNKKIATGYLLTIDNQIDPTTGTVKLKALFQNKDNSLFPNQFVNARLLLDVKRGTVVVPAAAIQQGPKGNFVYVVNTNHTVEVRYVKVGPAEGDTVSVVTGLSPGELIVVEGADRLREGTRVEIQKPGDNSSNHGT